MKKYFFSKTIALSLGVLAMSLLIGFIVLAWTEPTSSPPEGNVSPMGGHWTEVSGVLIPTNTELTAVQVEKLTIDIIDPVFNIDGEKYATYVADFAGGARIETSGVLNLKNREHVIDFTNLKKGSDLWLFWKASNKKLENIVVNLTPGFNGNVWYEKSGEVIILYSNQDGEISYSLSAPRVDYLKWPTFLENESIKGIDVLKYE